LAFEIDPATDVFVDGRSIWVGPLEIANLTFEVLLLLDRGTLA